MKSDNGVRNELIEVRMSVLFSIRLTSCAGCQEKPDIDCDWRDRQW